MYIEPLADPLQAALVVDILKLVEGRIKTALIAIAVDNWLTAFCEILTV